MFCISCGTQLPDTAQFCYKCGQKTNSIAEQKTNTTNIGDKTFEEVFTPEVLERTAQKMAEKVAENPASRYKFLLHDYEEAAQKFVSDEMIQGVIRIDNELDTLQDTSILNDPELKKLRPVLYLYRGAMHAWQMFYRRWKADTDTRKHKDVQQDFVSLGTEGIVKCITTTGLSEHSASVIYGQMGLRGWLEYRMISDNIYFLLEQGFKLNDLKLSPPYETLLKRYYPDLVKLATDQAIERYQTQRPK